MTFLNDCGRSYYRIRDLKTGVVLRNLTESCNHSFGSAFVDTDANGTPSYAKALSPACDVSNGLMIALLCGLWRAGAETLWVVGSAWWRPALELGEQRGGLLASRSDSKL